ncbi:MAG TPA: tripartite tricarboxylate transporter substrate-binding protein [Burkholderiales bacterium]|nr:tripartite tricarboxylate transporter substrate-binding protein [Burkholderiales bacterium]
MTKWSRLLLLFAALGAQPALAQQEGVVRIVLGYPAGATSDLLSRLLAEHMRGSLGRAVIVENKPGAGGQIANEVVKAAAPDGATILVTPVATMAIFPHSFAGKLRYDPFKDFAPVAHLSNFQLGFGVASNVPANTLADYVALVKKDAKYGFYGSAAPGSLPHFFGVMFARAAGIELTHVPYKGTAPVMQAIAGGEISAISTVAADIGTLVKSGKARLLAVSGEKRMSAFPDVPTFKESGYDLVALPWYAMFAPAGTPQPIIEKYSAAAIAAVHDPAMRQRLEDMGLEPTGLGPQELAKILKADYDKWGPVIRASGFKPGQ